MNLLIPTIMLISCLYIVWYMMREKQPSDKIGQLIEPELTEEQMLIIEQKIHRDKYEIGWWKMNGRFNVMQYVKYLEYKEVNG